MLVVAVQAVPQRVVLLRRRLSAATPSLAQPLSPPTAGDHGQAKKNGDLRHVGGHSFLLNLKSWVLYEVPATGLSLNELADAAV